MHTTDPSDALVFFGATGDLADKKIFPALYNMTKRGHLDVPVIGVASSQWTLDQLIERREWHRAVRRRRRRRGRVHTPHQGDELRRRRLQRQEHLHRALQGPGGACRAAHYLAIPPSLFETVVEGLGSSGCAKDARVIVEKPFGR